MPDVHDRGNEPPRYTAFCGHRRVAHGGLAEVARAARQALDRGANEPTMFFDDRSGASIEIDLRGSADEVVARLARASDEAAIGAAGNGAARGRGRPKLGVVAREVTLLPRHWEWLAGQPGGASVALRRLIDEARRANADRDRAREAREAAYRFMSALAGNLPGFEEAARALFAADAARFDDCVSAWPADVAAYARRLAAPGLDATAARG